MKRILVIGLVLASMVALIFAIPVLAHGPEESEMAPCTEGDWEAMHEVCEEGDWGAMHEACEEGDWEAMHEACEEGDYAPAWRWGDMGGHMGRGMMGW